MATKGEVAIEREWRNDNPTIITQIPRTDSTILLLIVHNIIPYPPKISPGAYKQGKNTMQEAGQRGRG